MKHAPRVGIYAIAVVIAFTLPGCQKAPEVTSTPKQSTPPSRAVAPASPVPLVHNARSQIGVTLYYDPVYAQLAYPGGDVPVDRGVCTDVVIRAFRKQGLDLQQRVHEDMRGHFANYPQRWGLHGPDANIDHRRVPNLQRWFERQGWALPATTSPADYRAGDLVTWDLGGGVPHIGVVSDHYASTRIPLIIHNIGNGVRQEDILLRFRITGHYRPQL